jgi:hypothetical protein
LNTSAPLASRPPIFAALLCLSGLVAARDSAPWPDNCLTRLDASNAMVDLNIDILSGRSATMTLERWCDVHDMAAEPRIVALQMSGSHKSPSAEQLKRLKVADASEVRHRSVELRCGEHVLSKADNWYVPARLTADMNRLLETTDTPFGKVVAALQPMRKTFEMKTLWSPLPADWSCDSFDAAAAPDRFLPIPAELFQVRALLLTADKLPFSEVSEIYQGALLNFPAPAHPGIPTSTATPSNPDR